MSSLRNAVQRRNHKERAQPLERSKWGLLEKHKDYSLRAKDHNTKKRKIKALQQKAAERNEDEFYFGMMSSKTRGGLKIAERGEDNSGSQRGAGKSLSQDVVKLMKTQDSTYLQTVLQSTRKAADKLEKDATILEQGVSLDGSSLNKKMFDDNGDEVQGTAEDLAFLLGAEDEALDHFSDDEEQSSEINQDPGSRKKQHTLEVKQRQLQALRSRQQKLTLALQAIESQRARMTGTAAGVNKSGVRYKARSRRR